MEQFEIRKDAFKEIRKALLIKAIPNLLLVALFGFAIAYFSNNKQHNDVKTLPFAMPLILGLLAIGLYRGIKRQETLFHSYRLILDNNSIIREQINTPTITISYLDIKEIIKNSNGSFTIKGKSSLNVIGVPSQIEDYEKLEKLISEIKPITEKMHAPFLQKFRGLISILTLGSMAAVAISNDKRIVGVSGTVILAILGYSFFEIRRSKNIDFKTKKIFWWIILVAASVSSILYYKLSS